MPYYAWAALGVSIVSALGGAATAGVRGLRAWRDFRRSRRALVRRMSEVSRGVFDIEAKLDRLDNSATRILDAKARLQKSLAAASIVAAAAGDARAALRVLSLLRR